MPPQKHKTGLDRLVGLVWRAVKKGDEQGLSKLLAREPVRLWACVPENWHPMVATATANRRSPVLRALLSLGANPNREVGRYNPSISIAIGIQDLECARLLVDHGIDKMTVDLSGVPAMQSACRRSVAMARVFVKGHPLHEAVLDEDVPQDLLHLVNERAEGGVCALHLALHWAPDHVVKQLLRARADTSATTHWGETPLHAAARRADRRWVERLLILRCDPDARDAQGRTPLMEAVDASRWHTVEVMLRCGCAPGRSLRRAIRLGAPMDLLRQLVVHGADARDPAAMVAAAYSHNVEAARLLIQHGARLNVSTDHSANACSIFKSHALFGSPTSAAAASLLREEHAKCESELKSLRDGSHPLVAAERARMVAELAGAGMALGTSLGAEAHRAMERCNSAMAVLAQQGVTMRPHVPKQTKKPRMSAKRLQDYNERASTAKVCCFFFKKKQINTN